MATTGYKLIVIGDKTGVDMFKMMGLEGYYMEDITELKRIYDAISYQSKNIAGIVLTTDLDISDSPYYKKLQDLDIPMIQLYSNSEGHGYHEIESLVERAIGMKLDNINI